MARKKVRKLYKTTIVVYSDYDPQHMESSDLVLDAETGDSICDSSVTKVVNFTSAPQGVREFFSDAGEWEPKEAKRK